MVGDPALAAVNVRPMLLHVGTPSRQLASPAEWVWCRRYWHSVVGPEGPKYWGGQLAKRRGGDRSWGHQLTRRMREQKGEEPEEGEEDF